MKTSRIFISVIALLLLSVVVEAATAFSGIPALKVSEGGTARTPQTLEREQAANLGCVISQIGDQYYWATRENKRMRRIESGGFITFLAEDGAGYVRVIVPGSKTAVSMLSDSEATFDYVEHLLIGLRSVTYYGSRK